MNTIAAIATPLGNGAISVIRVSGESALKIARELFSSHQLDFDNIQPRMMYLGDIQCENFSDHCFMVYFAAPNSYTGEDMIEFQCHGGARLAEEALKTILAHGAKIADKGEFTKRAFLNGKLNLSEAEGIADMISSENIAALNAGYRMMSGVLTKKINAYQEILLDLCSSLEASLDYPEELEEEAKANCEEVVKNMHISLKTLLSTAKIGGIIRNGINVAIVGAPNVGKSSLLNAIIGKDKAIVTDIAGTTRDLVEEKIEIDGVFINFIDTAGIRSTEDTVEKIGVEKAKDVAASADIVIALMDSTRLVTEEEQNMLDRIADKPIIYAYNKCDLDVLPSNKDGLLISAKDNINIDLLLNTVVDKALKDNLDYSGPVLTNLRHIDAIERALDSIKSVNYAGSDAPTECLLVDLKNAYYALGEITGNTASEDIIDRVFSKFCLGK